MNREFLEHLANVAGTEDLVNTGKLLGLVCREIRRKNTVLGATSA
jgi:hypothetical protein